MSRWLARLALPAAVATGVLVLSPAAWADSPVAINTGNVPTLAASTAHECSANQGGGPYSDTDVWVFVLPGNHTSTGDFVSLTAQFDTDGVPGADTTVTIPSSGGFLNGGPATSKAYLLTPAGWTLVGASAVITKTASFFTLSHTCPASVTSTSTPAPSTPPTPTPTDSPSTPPTSGDPTPTGSATPPGGGGSLPTTGVAVGGIVVLGVGLIAGGAALVMARRRQDRSTVL